MKSVMGRSVAGIWMLDAAGKCCLVVCMLVLLFAASAPARAAAPATPVAASSAAFDGQWHLIGDDSDDVVKLWHEGIREQMKRTARRASPSGSPMAMPANPGQHINLPVFLGTFKRVVFRSSSQRVVIEQQQFQRPKIRQRDHKEFVAPDNIAREVNLHPEATSISLRESARRPPTMFIGGWEKGALVIETTTDEGLMIEERWHVTRDDDGEILHRQVRLRSSIWGEKIFEQQFGKQLSS